MDQLNNILTVVSNFVWGWPMALILLGAGLVLTLRTVFIQLRGFKHGVGIATGKYDDPAHQGQLTHFQALSAALSATIGIGNIAGVAIAIYWGGPGAIFWMWVTAAFGMAIKYAECTLAIQFRKVEKDGNIRGGPMYYIEMGMGRFFKPLAWMFAFCTAVAAFGAGNMVQSNTIAHSLIDALNIGKFSVQSADIRSADINETIGSYNQSFEAMQAGLAERRRLQVAIDEAEDAFGSGSTQVAELAGEKDSVISHLGELQAATQSLRDELLGLRLYTVDETDGGILVLTEAELASELKDDAKTCRLSFGNHTIDGANIVLVYNEPINNGRWIIGFIIAILVGSVIIGGIRRIGHVASYLVPFMSVVYVASALLIISLNYDQIIPAFKLILYHAFNPTAVVGGAAGGATVWMTFTWGLRRGLFSNEAGQGSAAMAHSTAKVEEPVREGLVAMLGPFIDTLVICTMTALVIITTNQWASGETGAVLTMNSFDHALPFYGMWMVVLGVLLFAFSTVIAWSYYGEKGIEYIGGRKSKIPYKWLYVIFTLLGARFDLQAVWSYADTANGLMAVPNLVALVALSGALVVVTKKYMDEKKRGLHIPFKELMKQRQGQ